MQIAPHQGVDKASVPHGGARRVRRAILLAFIAAIATVFAWLAAERWITTNLREDLDQSLLLTSRAVEAEIDRFRALPDVAGEDARIRSALADPRKLDDANRYLEVIAAHAGASELFLINALGRTIAASNWNRPGSFVGQDYSFRPYFQKAMQSGHGQFYAIGVTTGVPGYFLSTRIRSGSKTGVLVVKVDLRPLQETWRSAAAQMALVDADGVIFLSGRPDWLYRPFAPLSPATITRLTQTRAYDGVDLLAATPLLNAAPLGPDVQSEGWIARLTPIEGTGWQLIGSRSSAVITAGAFAWALGTALLALLVAGFFATWHQRRQIIALRLSQSQKLEAMVAARTADLAREVEARRQAETDLRATQEHLIHSEKMAALGRMSTAIVHEISQPLSAMEATLTAAELSLLPKDSKTGPRLATARGLIRRMQRTTKHLKSFGRKEAGERSEIDLRGVVTAALELVTPRARVVGIVPTFDPPAKPVLVMAGAVRMEQVVVNLLVNALDAVEGRAGAAIEVNLSVDQTLVSLSVVDTGHGIAADSLPRITEPFYTSKTSGEGLGLGLSICKAILADFGGDLLVTSLEGQQTTATVTLPRAVAETEAAE